MLGLWADGAEILVACGVLNVATGEAATAGSLFQIGSITKVWTATMIMQLVDEGRLSLRTTIAEVLPGVRIGVRDIGAHITIGHLITHTSGIEGDILTDPASGACRAVQVQRPLSPPRPTTCSRLRVSILTAAALTTAADCSALRRFWPCGGSVPRSPIIGHDGNTIGQSAYLRIDPRARVAACLLTNSEQSRSVFAGLFAEIFRHYAGAAMPEDPGPADVPGPAGLERHVGEYVRAARRFDVSLRSGRRHVVATAIDSFATLLGQDPEELVLYPADSSGVNFVYRCTDEEPWIPVTFGQLDDQTPYLFTSRRIAPRMALCRPGRPRRRQPGALRGMNEAPDGL